MAVINMQSLRKEQVSDTVAACRMFCNRLGQENLRNTAELTIAACDVRRPHLLHSFRSKGADG
jgi:hypothetical protein